MSRPAPATRRLAAGTPPALRRWPAGGSPATSAGTAAGVCWLSPALAGILARMVEAKLAAAGSPQVAPASLPAQSEGMVGPGAGGPAGQDGG